MTVEKRTLERIDRLVGKGQLVLNTHKENPPGVIGFPTLDHGLFSEWRSQSLTALRQILKEDHTYVVEFDRVVDKGFSSCVKAGMGILRSLKEDIDHGDLTELKTLVVAEVFSDFLDMARHLIDHGYVHPAASLTGAVLEDGLRRVGASRGVNVKDRDDLSTLNQKCTQAGVFNVLTSKKINKWTHLRNQADHGRFAEYGEQDIQDMHKGVADFLEQYLT